MAWPGLGCICLNEFPVLFERALQGCSPRQPCDSSYSAVLWTSLSSAWPIRACCLTWSSTTSPNPDSVDLFQSSPKIKNSRAGKRKRCKKPCSVPFVGTVSHPSFRLSQLLPRVPKESLGKEPAFLHERQGKKLTFLAIQSSPYSPASHFSSAVIQECSAQLFSLKYQTLQRGEKKKVSAAMTQAKNNPFLVNKMRLSFPSQLQHSTGSFLCFICSKCEKAKGGSKSMNVLPGSGAPASSGAQSRAEVRSLGTAQATPSRSSSPRASCQQPSLGFLQPDMPPTKTKPRLRTRV